MTRPSNHDMFNDHHEHVDGSYVKKDYEHQEYPKVVGQDEDGRDIIANSAEEEAQLAEPAELPAEEYSPEDEFEDPVE